MLKTTAIRPRMAPRSNFTFAIVASQYNIEFTQPLADHAYQELSQLEGGASITLVWAPGSFEIPVLVKALAAQNKYDAILALGLIIQGETGHANLIADSITQGLQRIAIDHTIPVIHEVLLVQNEEHARVRCTDPALNRGIEAARAAVTAVRAIREINLK
jgi:6,7-dimethyl-8-ribityllumazine synthase